MFTIQNIFKETNTFIKPFDKAYENGSASLNLTNKACLKIFKDIQKKYTASTITEEEHQKLLHLRELCSLAKIAKEDYYKNSSSGRVASFFQQKLKSVFGVVGYKTVIEQATSTISQIDGFLKTVKPTQLPPANDTKSWLMSTDGIHLLSSMRRLNHSQKTICKMMGGNDRNPTHPAYIFISKPNGDIYIIPRYEKDIGSGSGRVVYKGYLSSLEMGLKEIAIVTSMPISGISAERCDAKDLANIEITTKKMKEEQKQLKQLGSIDGIINIYDHYSMTIGKTEVGFTMMDYYKEGSLDLFLDSKKGKELSLDQKRELMLSLSQNLKAIHKAKKIHRDIKEKNILIDFDTATQKVNPILIDFETCIDISDKKRKEEISATPKYYAPECITSYQNCLQNEEHTSPNIARVTTPEMDIWSLGLVFYRIWYGKSFFQAIDKEFDGKTNNEQIATLNDIYNNKKDITAAFKDKKIQHSAIDTMIRSMLELDPKKRKINLINA